MKVTVEDAREAARKKAAGLPGLLQNDLNDVEFEVAQLKEAMARGDHEAAFIAAKNVADTASTLMGNLRGILKMPYYGEEPY